MIQCSKCKRFFSSESGFSVVGDVVCKKCNPPKERPTTGKFECCFDCYWSQLPEADAPCKKCTDGNHFTNKVEDCGDCKFYETTMISSPCEDCNQHNIESKRSYFEPKEKPAWGGASSAQRPLKRSTQKKLAELAFCYGAKQPPPKAKLPRKDRFDRAIKKVQSLFDEVSQERNMLVRENNYVKTLEAEIGAKNQTIEEMKNYPIDVEMALTKRDERITKLIEQNKDLLLENSRLMDRLNLPVFSQKESEMEDEIEEQNQMIARMQAELTQLRIKCMVSKPIDYTRAEAFFGNDDCCDNCKHLEIPGNDAPCNECDGFTNYQPKE